MAAPPKLAQSSCPPAVTADRGATDEAAGVKAGVAEGFAAPPKLLQSSSTSACGGTGPAGVAAGIGFPPKAA